MQIIKVESKISKFCGQTNLKYEAHVLQ